VTPTPTPPTTAEGRYSALLSERDPFLRRAEDAAKLTIPSLLPPEGHNGTARLPQPYQSVGARGVSNLAAKLLLALFPPGSSFFRLSLDEKMQDELTAELEGDEAAQTQARTILEAGLARVEQSVLNRIERSGSRAPLHDGIIHCVFAGNVLLQVLDDGSMRCHYLNKYVCKRDPAGNVFEIIVKECFARATLPEKALQIVEEAELEDQKKDGPSSKTPANVVDVYTHVQLKDGNWDAYQEVKGKEIPGTRGKYPKDKSPWLPLRFSRIEGESYGRGMIEMYFGDLRSLEALSQALVEFAGIAAKIIFLRNPAGITRRDSLVKARNGAVIDGDPRDVSVLGLEKFADWRITKEEADGIEKRLNEAFLVGSAAVRDAERVTAEEIRLLASELETALGGLYSVLASELQRPLAARYMHIMEKDKTLPELPKGAVKVSIVTGLEALGRGGDSQKLDMLLASTIQVFGPEAVKHFNIGEYLVRKGTALGIGDIKGLVKSPEEVAAADQQQNAQDLLLKTAPVSLKNAAANPQGAE
jgi:hypothetical protein